MERLSQDDIVTALSAVPHDFRDVIVLVDLGDFSYADAAQILDIPVGTVMSRLHRGTPHPEAGACRVRPGGGDMTDPCAHCEEMMQPYLDHVLTDEETDQAEAHLDECERLPAALPVRGEPADLRAPGGDGSRCRRSSAQKLAALRIPLD